MKKNVINIILVVLWLIITVITMFHHELWRDEAQVWCIVRDCNFPEIFNNARIEGHPLLWYLLVFPFAKLGLSVISMQFLAFFTVFLGILYIIFKSNLNNFQKVITVFSAGLLYYMPVIARNYALILPVLCLISLFWDEKENHPYIYVILLILLSQTHSYMLGLCCVLTFLFTVENYKKSLLPCFILFMNLTFLFFWYKTGVQTNYALQTKNQEAVPFFEILVFTSKVYLFQIINFIKPLIKYADIISSTCFLIPLTLIFTGIYRADKKIFFLAISSISYIFGVFSFIYFNGILYQKLFIVILILIFTHTLIKEKNKLIDYSLNFLLILSCITSIFVVKDEIKYNFSGGAQMAKYIKLNYSDVKTFIAYGNPYLYSSISAYLPETKFYSPVINDYISFYTFKPEINNVDFPFDSQFIITDEQINVEKINIIYKTDDKNLSSKTEREVFTLGTIK